MENLKDLFNDIYELIKPILLIILMAAGICVLYNGFFFFTIKIDESNLGKIRFCPSCGIDLINNS